MYLPASSVNWAIIARQSDVDASASIIKSIHCGFQHPIKQQPRCSASSKTTVTVTSLRRLVSTWSIASGTKISLNPVNACNLGKSPENLSFVIPTRSLVEEIPRVMHAARLVLPVNVRVSYTFRVCSQGPGTSTSRAPRRTSISTSVRGFTLA